MRAHTLAVALLALTAAAAGQRRRDRGDRNSGGAGGVKGFIRVSGNKFVDDGCGDFVPVGWNTWVSLVRQGVAVAGNARPGTKVEDLGSNYVTNVMDKAHDAGFNLFRLFAHGEETSFMLQTAPGQYDESIWRGLDYIIALAGSRGIRALVVPINNWLSPHVGDGKETYVEWAGLPPSASDEFWTNSRTRDMVKAHLNVMLNRKNVFTGRAWKDEPAIFGFNLFNEPRCPAAQDKAGCPKEVTGWINEISAHIKGIDTHHLVTVGEEGFFEYDSGLKDAGPWGIPENVAAMGRYWSASVGQDFTAQHSASSIDFAAIHMWPDNWNTTEMAFPPVWIDTHIQESRKLGKPLLMEEFGKQSNGAGDKQPVYDSVYGALVNSLANGDNFRGALFWRWAEDGGNDATTVQTGDAAWQTVQRYVKEINEKYQGKPVSGCSPIGGATPAVSASSIGGN